MSAQRHASLSDLELVTLAESLPAFQRDGIEREVLLRLAHRAGHEAGRSDAGRVRRTATGLQRYNHNATGAGRV